MAELSVITLAVTESPAAGCQLLTADLGIGKMQNAVNLVKKQIKGLKVRLALFRWH